jgi:hypothetical protein
VVGLVVDVIAAREHVRKAQPSLQVVAEVPEQERGGHAGDEDADREHHEPPVDERERGGDQPDGMVRRRGSAGARAAAQQDRRGRGTASQGVVRAPAAGLPDGDLERFRGAAIAIRTSKAYLRARLHTRVTR